jgi:putative chitobiose transport system permease protein
VSRRKSKKVINLTLTYIALILIAILCAGPFIWMVSASFKSGQNIYDINLIPKHATFSNYTGVISFLSVPKYIANTLIITISSIILDVIFSAMCAYPLACMNFKGKNLIMGILVATMIIPAAAGMIITYLIISKVHLLNTLTGVILPGSVKVFSIILLRQSYLGIPKEMVEAARIDGAGELKIWRKVMMPGIMPSISTIVIFDFISRWNSLNF